MNRQQVAERDRRLEEFRQTRELAIGAQLQVLIDDVQVRRVLIDEKPPHRAFGRGVIAAQVAEGLDLPAQCAGYPRLKWLAALAANT